MQPLAGINFSCCTKTNARYYLSSGYKYTNANGKAGQKSIYMPHHMQLNHNSKEKSCSGSVGETSKNPSASVVAAAVLPAPYLCTQEAQKVSQTNEADVPPHKLYMGLMCFPVELHSHIELFPEDTTT